MKLQTRGKRFWVLQENGDQRGRVRRTWEVRSFLSLQLRLGLREVVRVGSVFREGLESALEQGRGPTWPRERRREGQLL